MKSFLCSFALIFSTSLIAKPIKYADSLMLESEVFGEAREIMISLPKFVR